jgi:hypothetical protein
MSFQQNSFNFQSTFEQPNFLEVWPPAMVDWDTPALLSVSNGPPPGVYCHPPYIQATPGTLYNDNGEIVSLFANSERTLSISPPNDHATRFDRPPQEAVVPQDRYRTLSTTIPTMMEGSAPTYHTFSEPNLMVPFDVYQHAGTWNYNVLNAFKFDYTKYACCC